MARFVLDSWAVLAWLQGEGPGALVGHLIDWADGDEAAGDQAIRKLRVDRERPTLLLNIVNLGEILYTTGRRKGEREAWQRIADVRASQIQIVSAEESLVLAAASLKMRHAIAYADAFAAATAAAHDASLVTGDPELRRLRDVRVVWIGNGPRGAGHITGVT